MKGPWKGLVISAALVLLVGGGGLLAIILLFPPARVKALVEAQASRASGYTVRLAEARLALDWPGLAIQIEDLTAEAPDGSQSIRAPRVEMRVALGPLLGQRLEVGRLTVGGLEATLRPATGGPPVPGGAAAPAAPSGTGTLLIPHLDITDARFTMIGPDGTNTLSGLNFRGGLRQSGAEAHFEGEARAMSLTLASARDASLTTLAPLRAQVAFDGGAAGGVLKGDVAADSLILTLAPVADAAPPARPLRLPGPRSRFEATLRFGAAPDAQTRFDGRLGPLPFRGSVQSRQAVPSPAWKSAGEITLAAVTLDSLKSLLPAEALAPLKAYALGGRCEGGTFRFQNRPTGDSLDYTFTTRITGITASLPNSSLPNAGRVIDDGALDLTLVPTRATCAGQLRSGGSSLRLTGEAGMGERAPWRATVQLNGPAAEALRFLPPQGAPQVTAGRLDLDVTLNGRLGDTAPPAAAGRLTLDAVAFRHAAVAVPVSRLDLRTTFSGDRALIEAGQLVAGQSSARFQGEVTDFKHPKARLDIAAGTLNLDELFPAPVAGAAPKPAVGAAGAAAPPAAIPVAGRITIEKLQREKTVLTHVGGDYAITAAGMEMKNLVATAWGGRVTGNLTLKPTGDQALDYSGNFDIADAKLSEMLTALTKIRGLDGKIQTSLSLSGRNGPSVNPLMALTLDARALVLEGAMANIPAVRKIAEALSFSNAAPTSFPFKTLKSRLRVVNGFVNLDSCLVTEPSGEWNLAGRIGLDGSLDVPIRARLATTLFAGGSDLRRVADLLAGPDGRLPLTLTLSGSLTAPQVSVDLEPLLKQAKEKAKGALGDELRKRIGGLFKKPGG